MQKEINLAGIIFPKRTSHNKSKYSHTTKKSNLDSPYFLFLKSDCISINLNCLIDEEKISNKILKPNPVRFGAILSNMKTKEKEALEFYGRNLGLTFQIADDTLDYNSDLKLFGKKIGQDFYEGKITLPIILLFQKANHLEREKLRNIFSKLG